MKKMSLLLLTLSILFVTCTKQQSIDVDIDLDPTEEYTAGNLVATDALGRKLPDYSEAGRPRSGKYVAMFYWTWHIHHSANSTNPVKDISKILAEHPEAINNFNDPAWPAGPGYYYWGEPLFDYYINSDRWVVRKHAEMLAEADVDVIVFDCTNGSWTWPEGYIPLCEVFSQAKKDGVDVPKIAFLLPFGIVPDSMKAMEDLWTNLYSQNKFSDLWFYWDGKPLVMYYPEGANATAREFFTFRPGWPTYNNPSSRTDQWSWLQIAPQNEFGDNSGGGCEEMAVSVAQNWSEERGLTAMNAPGAFGRSYTKEKGHNNDPDAVNWGYNFQEQWDRALQVSPELVFVTGWNEWNVGQQENWGGQYNAFPDQFDQEHSRDIEPMKGGHGDNYYYQLISNVRRFKGIPEPGKAPRAEDMAIDGNFAKWEKFPAFESYPGNTFHRNNPGWKGIQYTNKTGRNDIVRSKVAYDDEYLYFYVETNMALTPSTDKNWMMLFINSDRDHLTGWEGYDYVINRMTPASGKAVLEKCDDNEWKWSKESDVEYAVRNKMLELRIPRTSLGIEGKVNLEFKWVDNMQAEGDIMDFYLSGDAAPLGRFNYLVVE